MTQYPRCKSIELDWYPTTIGALYSDAITLAKKHKCDNVKFNFNGANVVVATTSPEELSLAAYNRVMEAVADKGEVYL